MRVTTDQLTMENYDKYKHHLTRENAEKAYAGACWANNKADELGIDKYAVASRVGNAVWDNTTFTLNARDKY